jgi:predicted peroxiredoxin
MRNSIRWVPAFLFAGAALLCVTCFPSATPPPAGDVRDGVFIHVSTGPEDPHRVLMALKMAEVMSADKDVLMYFDIRGVNVLAADSPDLAREPFTSSHAQIRKLLDAGVEIYACPSCLEVAGKTAADLMDGVEIADKNAFFDFTDGRILTLDY